MSIKILNLDPPHVICTEPISCVNCGKDMDADEHTGQYSVIEGLPLDYPWAKDGEILCSDCTLVCVDCGEDVMDKGDFIGMGFDGKLYCDSCFAVDLCAGE